VIRLLGCWLDGSRRPWGERGCEVASRLLEAADFYCNVVATAQEKTGVPHYEIVKQGKTITLKLFKLNNPVLGLQ
jgi:hypothetical protein